ncbi:MAG: hypothetical protein WEB00_13175 [Dehalococcoidia bacterium]
MRYFVFGLAALFVALLAAANTANAGKFYAVENSGTGSGGPNQLSTLRVSCNPDDMIHASGFFGVDKGTSILSSYPVDEDTYQLTWRNNNTADNITLRMTCIGLSNFFQGVESQVHQGAAGLVATGETPCPSEQLALSGGFQGLAPTSSLRSSMPDDDLLFYRASWRSAQGADDLKVLAYCVREGGTNFVVQEVTGAGAGGPNQASSLTLTCVDHTGGPAGIGFRGLDQGSALQALGPLDETRTRITWRNDNTPDTVTLRVVCVFFDQARAAPTL